MTNFSKNIVWFVVVVVVIGGFLFWQRSQPQEPKELQKLSVGIQTSPAMALVMVAKDNGFFEKEGLDLELKEFTAGKFALQAFLGGSLDIAVSGDVPVTLSTLQGNHFLVAGQVVKRTINEVRVVAQAEPGLDTAEQYFKAKKRKLATSFGGGPEFFTYEFLNDIGISGEQVELISQKPEDMPAALISGTVDAISIFDPFAFTAEKQMGDKAITFTNPNVYSELYVIDVQKSMRDNPERLEAFLKGLIEAEKFTRENPEEAKAIVIKYTKLDKETIDGVWGSFDFSVALTPELLDFWNREAQWAKDTGKVPQDTATTNFREIIFDAPLKKLAPSAVQL